MKKRIFISMHYLEIGGAEAALIGLLQSMDYTKYDVDLFLHAHRGEMMQFIPKEVNLLPEIKEYACLEEPMLSLLKNGQIRLFWGRLKAKWQFRQYVKKNLPSDITAVFQFVMNNVMQILPSLFFLGNYDVAISFLTPHNIVAKKVNAKRKFCWIHTDYSTIDVNKELELPVWNSYDRIISISSEVTRGFLTCFPNLSKKIVELENVLSSEFVRKRSELIDKKIIFQEMSNKKNKINILSVGRIVYAKNYDNVPSICKILVEKGLDVNWYIIGNGIDEHIVREKIKEEGMQNNVILLGKKDNPYPYIKACDIYVQPSRYEGKSITVREAQILCKPVVIAAYNTAYSQVADGIDGIIVPKDNEGCASGIADFIRNMELQEQITNYLKSHDYGNINEIKKFYDLVENVL